MQAIRISTIERGRAVTTAWAAKARASSLEKGSKTRLSTSRATTLTPSRSIHDLTARSKRSRERSMSAAGTWRRPAQMP